MPNLEWDPRRLLETSGNYWMGCTLHAAVALDLFTVLGDRALTVAQVAGTTRCSRRGLEMLLNATTAMNLVQKKGEKFSNTQFSRAFLSKESPRYLGHIINHHHHLVESWGQLDRAVKTGKPVRTRASWNNRKVRESFLMGMFNLGMHLAPQVAAQIDLSGRASLLDLGGGPGTYAIHFCLKNPGLKGTVFDLPTTRPFARMTIKRFDLGRRVGFQAGDFHEDPIKGTFDAAWLSHILHGESPAACQRVIDRAVAALNPGGLIMIHEFILRDTMDGPLFPALFSMNMLLGTEGGQSYSEGQLKAMLKKAGVKKIRRADFRGPNDSGIVMGTV